MPPCGHEGTREGGREGRQLILGVRREGGMGLGEEGEGMVAGRSKEQKGKIQLSI